MVVGHFLRLLIHSFGFLLARSRSSVSLECKQVINELSHSLKILGVSMMVSKETNNSLHLSNSPGRSSCKVQNWGHIYRF